MRDNEKWKKQCKVKKMGNEGNGIREKVGNEREWEMEENVE